MNNRKGIVGPNFIKVMAKEIAVIFRHFYLVVHLGLGVEEKSGLFGVVWLSQN